MSYAVAVPKGDWYSAEFADVFSYQPPVQGGNHPNVTILRHPNTEEELTIKRSDFQAGVVILNEMQPPLPGVDPIVAYPPGQGISFELLVVPGNQETVIIPFDVGWPTGKIILWD